MRKRRTKENQQQDNHGSRFSTHIRHFLRRQNLLQDDGDDGDGGDGDGDDGDGDDRCALSSPLIYATFYPVKIIFCKMMVMIRMITTIKGREEPRRTNNKITN